MKKFLLLCFVLLVAATPAHGEILEELWNKYVPPETAAQKPQPVAMPGRLLGTVTPERRKAFTQPWRYRDITYELHFETPLELARTVYSLALHAKDVDKSLPLEKFLGGVLGYHYSTQQICDWINDIAAGKFPSGELDENALLGMLLKDAVITIRNGIFVPAGKISHVLAAAPGKNRTFAANLRHERLHCYWDEDSEFRDKAQAQWNALSEAERADAVSKLGRYAQGNKNQLLEEWAVHQSELSMTDI